MCLSLNLRFSITVLSMASQREQRRRVEGQDLPGKAAEGWLFLPSFDSGIWEGIRGLADGDGKQCALGRQDSDDHSNPLAEGGGWGGGARETNTKWA